MQYNLVLPNLIFRFIFSVPFLCIKFRFDCVLHVCTVELNSLKNEGKIETPGQRITARERTEVFTDKLSTKCNFLHVT